MRVLVLAAAALAAAATVIPSAAPAAEASTAQYTAIAGSVGPAPGKITGRYTAKRMTIEVSLVPRHEAATARSAEAYLRGQGLAVPTGPASSPSLVRATGSSTQVSRAFRTTLSTYAGADGTRYFANSTPVYVPASLARGIIGVIGLSDTLRLQPR